MTVGLLERVDGRSRLCHDESFNHVECLSLFILVATRLAVALERENQKAGEAGLGRLGFFDVSIGVSRGIRNS